MVALCLGSVYHATKCSQISNYFNKAQYQGIYFSPILRMLRTVGSTVRMDKRAAGLEFVVGQNPFVLALHKDTNLTMDSRIPYPRLFLHH